MKPEREGREGLERALDDSLPESVVAASLAVLVGSVRRRRRGRQGLGLAGVASLVVAACLAWKRAGTPTGSQLAAGSVGTAGDGSAPISLREISDAELLAHFPGRAAGFATVNGRREFILLPAEGEVDE